jgi:hypothetical protein
VEPHPLHDLLDILGLKIEVPGQASRRGASATRRAPIAAMWGAAATCTVHTLRRRSRRRRERSWWRSRSFGSPSSVIGREVTHLLLRLVIVDHRLGRQCAARMPRHPVRKHGPRKPQPTREARAVVAEILSTNPAMTEGPMVDLIAAALDRAVTAERKRCEKIAVALQGGNSLDSRISAACGWCNQPTSEPRPRPVAIADHRPSVAGSVEWQGAGADSTADGGSPIIMGSKKNHTFRPTLRWCPQCAQVEIDTA